MERQQCDLGVCCFTGGRSGSTRYSVCGQLVPGTNQIKAVLGLNCEKFTTVALMTDCSWESKRCGFVCCLTSSLSACQSKLFPTRPCTHPCSCFRLPAQHTTVPQHHTEMVLHINQPQLQRCHQHQHRSLHQLPRTHSSLQQHAAARRAQTTAAHATATAPLDQQAVALAIPQPPADYDYKADILPETLEVVQQQYPQLLGLVEAGTEQEQERQDPSCCCCCPTTLHKPTHPH